MNDGNRKPGIVLFAAGASLTGGLIGAGEAAALVAFDVELTASRGGAVLLVAAAFGLAAAASFLAAIIFAFARRTPPGRFLLGGRTTGVTFAVAAALLFYGGYYLNALVLPGKLHPVSLAADVVLLAACWSLIRFAPAIKIRARWLLAAFALILAGTFAVSVVEAGSSRRLPPPEVLPPQNAPNLLLITLDTTRADRLGAYGGPSGLTPNLDRLAASGVVFERAYCAMPLTGPSHAALLTGRTPRELGVVQNGVALGADAPTLAELLRSRGYRTAAVVAAFTVSSKLGFARGFEFYDDGFAADDALSRLTLARLAGSLGIVDVKARLQRPADEVTASAVRWLENPPYGPFFLWVHYFDPHTPYEPPEGYREKTRAQDPQVRAYDGEVAFMDAQIGRLLGALRDFGLRENTVIVATADHGESLGEHGYYYDHGRYVYEQSMHVPLIVTAPPGFGGSAGKGPDTQAGITSLTSMFDYLIANLAPDGAEEKPDRPKAAPFTNDIVFGEAFEDGSNYRMVVARAAEEAPVYKLILDARTGAVRLYDLSSDAGESKNVAPERPAITRALLRALEEHFGAQPELPSGAATDAEMMKKLRSLGYM
jgi:hypothetical protein